MKESQNIKPIDLMPHKYDFKPIELMPHKDNIELPYKDKKGNYHPTMESVRAANEQYWDEKMTIIEKSRHR